MKRKFKILMSFLLRLRKDNIQVSWHAYAGDPEWNWPNIQQNVSIPQNMLDMLIDITDSKINEIFDMDCYSETDYYRLTAEIIPKEKKIIYSLEFEEYSNQAETYVRELTNSDLEDYFKRTGVEIIEARYSGGGDSGDIDSVTIDGQQTNINWQANSFDEKLIWDTLYNNLENAYGGWEIDDGSRGTIELGKNMEIIISHEWYMREMVDCDDRYEITEEDLEE